jgi:hypothetical protein
MLSNARSTIGCELIQENNNGQTTKSTAIATWFSLTLATNRCLVLAILENAPGTKKRVALFNEQGRRIKGKENQALAEIALTKSMPACASNHGKLPEHNPSFGKRLESFACSGEIIGTAPDRVGAYLEHSSTAQGVLLANCK